MNSFGSKEAAIYLFEDNSEKDYVVITDFRMVIAPYLKYYIRLFDDKKEVFGKLSARFSAYDADKFGTLYFAGPGKGNANNVLELERRLSRVFRECHSQDMPAKKILYPDGTAAIEVFRIYR